MNLQPTFGSKGNRMRTRRSPLAFAWILAWAATASAGTTDLRTVRTKVYRAFDDPLHSYLYGSDVVPPTASGASGHAILTVNLAANTLTYSMTHDVAGEIGAQIRGPADVGANGGTLHVLPLGSPKNGVWNYTDADETELMAGRVYIVVQSATYPDGEIRGQIVCYEQPVLDKTICLRVVVQNLGPNAYIGSEPGLIAGARGLLPNPAGRAGNKLQVSVDIDEPTKPGLEPRPAVGPIVREFEVNIAPGDSIELDFGTVGIVLPTAGTNHVSTTSIAQGTNVDPVGSNDTKIDVFEVLPVLPAVGLGAGIAGLVLMAGAARRAFGRRRAAAPPAAPGAAGLGRD
jgi:hypothetical protein